AVIDCGVAGAGSRGFTFVLLGGSVSGFELRNAIDHAIESYQGPGPIVISNCTFVNNSSPNNFGGGAITTSTPGSLIQNSCFVNNTSGQLGGAVFVGYNPATIVSCHFINNSIPGNSIAEGGAIQIQNTGCEVIDSTFYYNSATHGGAVYSVQ